MGKTNAEINISRIFKFRLIFIGCPVEVRPKFPHCGNYYALKELGIIEGLKMV